MSLILVFLCARQGPSLLSSAPETARLHARCGERREQNFKKLFLFVCFPGSPQPGTEKETQGVDEARRGLQDVLSTLLSRYLRITEQHERHFPSCLPPQAFPPSQEPCCRSVPWQRGLCRATAALSYASHGLHCGSSGNLHCLWDILPPFPPSNKDSD